MKTEEQVRLALDKFLTGKGYGGGTVTGRFTGSRPGQSEFVSGRMSHENPNPQRIHRGDSPVSVLVEIDLSDLERRVMAQLSAKQAIFNEIEREVMSQIDALAKHVVRNAVNELVGDKGTEKRRDFLAEFYRAYPDKKKKKPVVVKED